MRAKKSFGQHFLTNIGAADRIVDAAQAGRGDHVLEVGPGRGVLTERLLKTGARVTAIEADTDLEPELRGRFPDLTLILADATRFDLETLGEASYILVSNLPYNVSKPLLSKFLQARSRFPRWVLMMQREVADRLLAVPSTKDWGPLSILFQNAFTIQRLLELGPGSFRPPPKVHSTVLAFERRAEPLFDTGDPDRFARTLFALFQERRKMLSNRLRAMGVDAAVLEPYGLTGNERMETFPLDTVIPLVRDIAARRQG